MINVKLLRIVTGEEVIAELVSEGDTFITVKNGLVILPTQSGVGFAPWAIVIDPDKPEITLSHNHVVYIAEVSEDVKKKYNELFGDSKLVTPNEKKLIL